MSEQNQLTERKELLYALFALRLTENDLRSHERGRDYELLKSLSPCDGVQEGCDKIESLGFLESTEYMNAGEIRLTPKTIRLLQNLRPEQINFAMQLGLSRDELLATIAVLPEPKPHLNLSK